MGEILYSIFITPIELFIELVFTVMNLVFKNPGFAIIFVSIAVQLLCFPLYKKADAIQEQERQKQKEMKHWLEHIKKTFKGDERFMMQQTYYRSVGYKPIYAVKGSLSLLLQIPFFIAAYHFLSNLEMLSNTPFLGIADLSKPDQMLTVGSFTINVLPVLMTVFNIISGIIYTKGFPIKDKIQTYGLACLFLVLLYKSPSGLVFYWTLNNLFSLLKNVFMKLIKNPKKVIRIFLLVIGIAAPIYVIFFSGRAIYLKLASVAFAGICFIPSIKVLIKSKRKTVEPNEEQIDIKTINTVFYLSITVLCLLLALIIPVSVIKSSPVEFISINYGPFGLIFNSLCSFIGLFFVWINIFYIFSSSKMKKYFSAFACAVTVPCIGNYLFFAKNLGIMSSFFVFDDYPNFSIKEIGLNSLVVVVLFAVVLLIYFKKTEIIKKAYQIAVVAMSITIVIGFVSINKNLAEEGHPERKISKETTQAENEKVLNLSKNGKNVVVLMLDRAISGYLPFAMEECPELEEMFDGFTYYSNTASFGLYTNLCTPALFGGYEYTPLEINKRENESLKSKQNEALLVLPKLFSDNGYDVTVCDPPYAGYRWIPDLSIYDGYDKIKAHNLVGKYSKEFQVKYGDIFETSQKRNLFFYSIMKAMPVVTQNAIYQSGDYWSSDPCVYTLSVFLDSYSVLENLPKITEFKNDSSDNFLMLQNDTTHEPLLLSKPDYKPSTELVSADLSSIISSTGETLNFYQTSDLGHYRTNICALLRVGEWLNALRENNVYDNTRIIIVGDHGRRLGQFDYMKLSNGIDAQAYNPLMLVKDFNSKGFKVSDEFMTNADTPSIAVKDIIENPINPFTKQSLNNSAKNDGKVIITTSDNYSILKYNGNVFDTSDGEWWSVHDNLFDANNWKKVEVN